MKLIRFQSLQGYNTLNSNFALIKKTMSRRSDPIVTEKENDENPPKRRSARLTRNTRSMAEDGPASPEKPEKKLLPYIKYTGAIKYYIESNEIAETSDMIMQWVDKQTDMEVVPMAFDMEWPFSFQTGPGKSAVIQICVETTNCYIFQLSKLKKLPAALMALLKHPKVRLHGVNIKNDFRKLARDFPEVNADVLIEKCVDLGIWCNQICETGGRWSLERLTNYICQLAIDKSKKVRMSKWHVIPLDENQLMYASIDVYIGQIIYRELEKRQITKLENEAQFLKENDGSATPEKLEKKLLPYIKYTGAIKYYNERNEIAETSDMIMQWVDKQTDMEVVPMAFDMKWPLSFQNDPGKSAVIQICVETTNCYIFQLSKLKKLPAALMALLKHPKVRLHGVNIENGLRKLARDFPEVSADVLIEKCVDLGIWCNQICDTNERWSLELLANYVCQLAVDKSEKVLMNKWHVIPLDENHLMYASIDVNICQVIYNELSKRQITKLQNET